MVDIAFEERVIAKWQSLRDSADKRGKEFDLSLMTVANLLKSKKCHYTGRPISFFRQEGCETASVDRVDNDKGYITGNVVACSQRVNVAKNDLSIAELKRIIKVMERTQK